MKKIIAVLLLALSTVAAVSAEEIVVKYFVVPRKQGAASIAGQKDFSKVAIYPMLDYNFEKKILLYIDPMEGALKSYKPKRDSMGMEYLPVYVKEDTKTPLFYVNPANRKDLSPVPKKDDKGQDYLPAYEMSVFIN